MTNLEHKQLLDKLSDKVSGNIVEQLEFIDDEFTKNYYATMTKLEAGDTNAVKDGFDRIKGITNLLVFELVSQTLISVTEEIRRINENV